MSLGRRRRRVAKPPGLMLTSLLDMFTIILIFLIVSFEAEDYNFRLNPKVTLPTSGAQSVFKPAVNLSITPDEIVIEQVSVVSLEGTRASPEHYAAGEIPEVVEALKVYYERAEVIRARLLAEKGVLEEDDDPAIIVVQAGKDLDYGTLYLVLRSASIAGFVRYRLAIMKK